MEDEEKNEQRIVIKFLTKISKSNTEIIEMLTVGYGDNTLKRSTECEWAKRFREGRVSVDDNPREGRPVTVSSPMAFRFIFIRGFGPVYAPV